MSLWLVLAVNSITLLFLLSADFSLIFGLMRIPNLTHGSFFILGAYLETSLIARGFDFWTAAMVTGLLVAAFGGVIERLILRRLPSAELAQVLVTLVMIEHDMDVALDFAERITVLHFGEVAVEGTRAEVVAHPRTREIYLGE
jgi:branched-subunit amino acid ABC-type transport system permease component